MDLSLGSSESNDNDYGNDESNKRYGLNTKLDLSDTVASDMLKMLREGSYFDVCIKLHDGEIKANKFVLAARCDYFAATFRWKNNNNHQAQDMQEIVINDCSEKIMTRIIEYIFSGILKVIDLKLLEFLELRDQIRKMFPGDKLEGKIEDLLKDVATEGGDYLEMYNDDKDSPNSPVRYPGLAIPPTDEEIVQALSLVETGNLQPEVLVELARAIETHIMNWCGSGMDENTMTLANLVSYGVIESVQNLWLNLESPPSDHLIGLIPCVTGKIRISLWKIWKSIQPHHTNDADLEKYNLVTFFDAIKCKELHLTTDQMNQEETEALVRAMTTRVEILHLEMWMWFQIEFDSFSKYEGDGKCREVHICCHSEYHLSSLLDSVNCKELHLFVKSRCLRKEETESLVRAMTSRVEIVHLGGKDKDGEYRDTVSLDFETLTKYKGDGKCREVHCNHVCIGWRDDDDDDASDYEYEDPDERDERRGRILITSDQDDYVYGLKDKWVDDKSAETWAEQMNWDFKVLNQDGEYLLSRKNKV